MIKSFDALAAVLKAKKDKNIKAVLIGRSGYSARPNITAGNILGEILSVFSWC